jgi:peroxin-16
MLSVHTTIQLLSLYHTTLLTKLPSQTAKPTLHNRYTTHCRNSSPLYSRIALSLQTLQYTELLIEMLAKRRGGAKTRWRAIVFIESLKAMCRLMLLRITQNRPLITSPLPEREGIPTEPENDEGEIKKPENWTMPRTSLKLPSLPSPGTLNSYLLSHVLTADDIKAAPSLLASLNTNPQLAAEVIYILRPVIYALLLQRWREQKRSWIPWLVGAGMEFGAYELAKKGREASGTVLTGLQKEEDKTRGGQMGWWALRGAFYESVTRYRLPALNLDPGLTV